MLSDSSFTLFRGRPSCKVARRAGMVLCTSDVVLPDHNEHCSSLSRHDVGPPTGALEIPRTCQSIITQSITHFQHGAGCVSKEILYLVSP